MLFVCFQLCSKGSVTELSKSLIEKGRKMDELMVAYILKETLQVYFHVIIKLTLPLESMPSWDI